MSHPTSSLGGLNPHSPSVAGGPPRVEYEVTTRGEDEYFALLRNALSSREPRLDLLAAAVGLIDDLPRAQAIGLLRKRAQAMDTWRANIAAHLPSDTNVVSWGPVGEVITLWLHTTDSRAEWTQRVIERLEGAAVRPARAWAPNAARAGAPSMATLRDSLNR
ncbi:MAG: PadR family transcriptional regulator [Vicinamibacteraceae bacterium]